MGDKTHAYERRLQLKHFFEDRATNQTRRTWCEMQVSMPEKSSEGWVNDGKVRIMIGEDKDLKASFLLSLDEASRFAKNLTMAIEDHEAEKAKLWRE
ncbi:MAG: hypothetical protein E4H14_08100 [Candidatus Thorarchaeota archaeon]|nr:MAG: hypothetical protein E4H14_08100 [Candidatus Thorarchaeota archaeon]